MAKLGFARGLLLLTVLLGSTFPFSQAAASPEAAEWSAVNIPAEGKSGKWVLASGSDIKHLTMAKDGTLYAYANPGGTGYTLFKSTDGGYGWSYTGGVQDNIVDIATAWDDANTIAYTTTSKVYKSTDAGVSFVSLPANPGGAGSNNVEITCMAIAYVGYYIIAVGTRDTDNAQYGGVYIFDESKSFIWTDSSVGNFDVYGLAFSPNFASDGQLVAVVTDETDTFVTTRIGEGGWGQILGNARLNKDNGGIPSSVAVDTSSDISFPDGYNPTAASQALFVGIDAGAENGDAYRINWATAPGNSAAIDLNIGATYGVNNVDVTSLAIAGTANLVAGAAGGAQIYFSTNGGTNWSRSTRPPTGQSKTYVLVTPNLSRAYAATSGSQSAFSYSVDGSVTWNQTGLIDTTINNILDLAISPSHSQDNTLFMLTFGSGEHSLWRSLDDGERWETVFSSALADVDTITKVEFPENSDNNQVIFAAGSSNGRPVIWKSTDSGLNFGSLFPTHDPTSGATFAIDTWAVVDDSTLFIGSYDGSNGVVYYTITSGLFYKAKGIAGTRTLYSIAISPSYEQDKTILVSNTFGQVYWSSDNGASFELLGQQLPELITGGSDSHNVTVAFDPGYSQKNTVYAASHCQKGATHASAIYRFIIDSSTSWKSIDGTMPSSAIIEQLLLSADGALYAANSKAGSGMERSLNPIYPLGPAFETVAHSLDSNATLAGLWLSGNQVWSADATNKRVMTYLDSLTVPVALTSPTDEAPGIDIHNVQLDWETLSGATTYRWQLDYDTDFSTVPTGFEGDTESSSARLPTLELSTTYYWRVRVTEPVLSPWSEKWSFTTSLGHDITAPELQYPEAGASGLPLKPIFQWNAVAGADKYEILVSTDVSFTSPVIVKIGDYALPTTAWQCDVKLDYDTAYYWKVRARSPDNESTWSAVSAFTTGSPPIPAPEAPEPTPTPEAPELTPSPTAPSPQATPMLTSLPPQPSTSIQLASPDWTKPLRQLGNTLLVIMIAVLITLIILTVRMWRL